MAENFFEIRYRFENVGVTVASGVLDFTVRLHQKTLEHVRPEMPEPPDWARLEVNQCRHCPLDPTVHTYCPVALSLVDVVEVFNPLLSFTAIEATVETPERTFTKQTTMQRALSSLIGLYMATSGCPNMDLLKPMARFHLPFATREETIYRAASSYLLAQYFLRQRGEEADLECLGLQRAYENIHKVNMGMAERLRSFSQGDASINALVLLDLFAHALPPAIDLKLKSLQYMFVPYLAEDRVQG